MQPVRYAAAGREDDLPNIVGGKGRDGRNWLRERLRTRDDVAFCARAARDKRPKTIASRPEIKQGFQRYGVRLTLNINFRPGSLKERVTVVIQVAKLPRDIVRELITEIDTGGETIPDAGGHLTVRRIDRPVPVEAIPKIGADLAVLPAGRQNANKSQPAAHTGH